MAAERRGDAAPADQRFGVDRDTFATQRTVVLACHNQTSVNRLLEVQDLFRDDVRIRFICVLGGASRFPAGVERLLRQAGVDRIVSWADLEGERYDLVLSASENIDFAATSGPVVVLPHGLGFNKLISEGAHTRLAGVPSPTALRTGRVHLVLSHPDQAAQLRAAYPEAVRYALLTGDPTFDRLLASMPLRERYRRLLDVGDRRLVLLASTWGPESALGRRHTLPRRLLAELPCDSYRVCVVGHPNIWARHDARHLAVYFADELDAGLLLIPPEAGWHAALVAADHVIADHGSLALYAAGLGQPLLLTESAGETAPGTPMAALQRAADHLDGDRDLRAQLDASMSTHDPRRFRHLTDRVFAHVGQATERLHDALYQALNLIPMPAGPALRRAPDPEPSSYRRASALQVHSEPAVPDTVRLDRYPAAVQHEPDERHLVVEETESNLRLVEKASVLCRNDPADLAGATAWASSALTAYPGARLAAGGILGGCVVVVRDGRRALVTSPHPRAEVSMLASAAYHCVRVDRFVSGELTVEVGPHRIPVRLEVTVGPDPPTAR